MAPVRPPGIPKTNSMPACSRTLAMASGTGTSRSRSLAMVMDCPPPTGLARITSSLDGRREVAGFQLALAGDGRARPWQSARDIRVVGVVRAEVAGSDRAAGHVVTHQVVHGDLRREVRH